MLGLNSAYYSPTGLIPLTMFLIGVELSALNHLLLLPEVVRVYLQAIYRQRWLMQISVRSDVGYRRVLLS